ncbi:MAG: hypothetical protein HXY46_04370 [Syntrophaceae bacterium]|nr:hypothetical protein [Syntrophaceae bacterium]
MRRIHLVPILLIFCFVSTSIALAEVQVRLRVIRASNVGQGIDPSLKDIHKELGSLFNFTSYHLLRDEILHLSSNRPVSISAREGRTSIETTLVGLQRGVAELRIRVVREGKDILNTQVRLSSGRTVLIGGPRLQDGVIIYALSGNF